MKIDTSCNIDGSVDITGCNLDIFSMSSDASHTVEQAIQTLNKAGLPVWSKITSVGTTYRGRQENVINVVQTLCQLAHKENTETAFELTFSKGCRGDKDADHFANESIKPLTITDLPDFPVQCKYAFYAFGDDDYVNEIQEIVNLAEKVGLEPSEIHYATTLTGNISQLFAYFNQALAYAHQHIQHYVIEATIFNIPDDVLENSTILEKSGRVNR